MNASASQADSQTVQAVEAAYQAMLAQPPVTVRDPGAWLPRTIMDRYTSRAGRTWWETGQASPQGTGPQRSR